MKKSLLSIGAALLFGFSAFAAGSVGPTTLSFDNAYQAAGAAQGKGALTQWGVSLAATETYQITISATNSSSYDLTAIEFAFVDDDATAGPTGYWGELSAFVSVERAIAAGSTFTVSGLLTVKTDAQIAAVPATLSATNKLAVNAKSSNSSWNSPGATASVSFALSGVTITIVKQTTPDGTLFTGDGSGVLQLQYAPTTLPAPYAAGDQFTITVSGTSSADISQFNAVAVDQSAAASYWAELSDSPNLEGSSAIVAGTPFSVSGVLTVTAVPADFTVDNANTLVLQAHAAGTMLGIQNLVVTVTPYTGPAVEVEPAVLTPTALITNNAYQAAGLAQAKGALTQFGVTATAGAEYEVTIQATNASSFDLTDIDFVLVDDSPAAGYWTTLSEVVPLGSAVAAGASINETVTLTLAETLPAGAAWANTKLVINTKSANAAFTDQTGNATATASVAFSNVSISVVKKSPTAISVLDAAKTVSGIYSVTGVQLSVEPTSGIYFVKYTDGTVAKVVKK
ncbi:MAG: hypothetical protein LBU90_07975 [Bacteroidales bacterium]|nr:hypothetical protein [Bacteroidales bacterium]